MDPVDYVLTEEPCRLENSDLCESQSLANVTSQEKNKQRSYTQRLIIRKIKSKLIMKSKLVQTKFKIFKNLVKLLLDFPNYAKPITPYENRMLRACSKGKVQNYIYEVL